MITLYFFPNCIQKLSDLPLEHWYRSYRYSVHILGPALALGLREKKFGINRIFMNPKIYQHNLRETRRTVLQGALYYKTHALILIKKKSI